jgi:hypothetical protein
MVEQEQPGRDQTRPERLGQFLCEFKELDGVGGSLVAASIRPFRLRHVGEMLAKVKAMARLSAG